MSTTTDKLALFKYDPSTDGAQTFNIKQALNDNWDKLDDAVKQILITLANKAPAGYGLGVLWNKAPDMDADQISATGFFMARKNVPSNNYWGIVSFNYDNESAVQWGISQDSMPFYGSVTKREKHNSTWGPWEWEIAPMDLNTEYRTTERYLRKPVYTMAFSFGALPNASDKGVAMPGTDGTCKIIEIHGYASNEMSLPGVSGVSEALQVTLTGIGNTAYIKTGADRSSATATIVAKYIKTTD